jgi:hypothetical protein
VWRMRVGVRFIYSGRRVLRGTGMAMVATVLQQLKGVGEVLGLDSVVWGSLRASWRSRRWTGVCGRRRRLSRGRQKPSTMARATGHEQGNGGVLGVAGVVESTWERGEGDGRSEATKRGRVLACPWRVHARSGASWHHGARRVLARAGSLLANGWYR